jgi:nicotinamide-nucleotide amidase
MKIELVAVGNELLSGMTVNTNAASIGEMLSAQGWKVARQTVLPDQAELLKEGLQEALFRSSCVIATGGLGPTFDDLTQPVASALFAQKPEPIPNTVGSASGWIFSTKEKLLILLPGVPQEMEVMFKNQVIPFLKGRFPSTEKTVHESFHLSLSDEREVDSFLREIKPDFPHVEMGIYPGYGKVSVAISAKKADQLAGIRKKMAIQFGSALFPSKTGKIEEAIQDWFIEKKMSLAFAESCTGGLMAAQITAIPDSSKYFLGSLVAYSNQLKTTLLKVSPQTLKKWGAVSGETVKEMAVGLLDVTKADFGLAVTGIAGPSGGDAEKPIGTIWYGIARKGAEPSVGTFIPPSKDRRAIILFTVNHLLGLLWRTISSVPNI